MRRCHTRSCQPWRVLPEAGHSTTSLYVTGLLMVCGAVFLHRSDAFLAAMMARCCITLVALGRCCQVFHGSNYSSAWPALNRGGLKSLEFRLDIEALIGGLGWWLGSVADWGPNCMPEALD